MFHLVLQTPMRCWPRWGEVIGRTRVISWSVTSSKTTSHGQDMDRLAAIEDVEGKIFDYVIIGQTHHPYGG